MKGPAGGWCKRIFYIYIYGARELTDGDCGTKGPGAGGGESFYFLKANTCRASNKHRRKNERTRDDDDVTSLYIHAQLYVMYIYT